MGIIIKTETVAAVRDRQPLWLDWHKAATAGLADDDLITTTTKRTPFGDYLLDISRLSTTETN